MAGLITLSDPNEENPEQNYIPQMADQPPTTPVAPPVASTRASKANVALGDKSPGYDQLFSSIMQGTDERDRQQALLQHQLEQQQTRMGVAQEYLANRPKDQPLSDQELNFINNLNDDDLHQAQDDPNTFFEDQYAKWMVNAHQGTNLANAVKEDPVKSGGILDAAENIHFQKEMAQKWSEDLEARWESEGIGGKALAYGETFVPFYTWHDLNGAAKGAPTSSMLPGSNLEEQYRYLTLLPKDQYASEAKAAIDQIASHNMLDAVQFAQGLTSYATSDKYLNNALGVSDIASVVGPAAKAGEVAASATRLLTGSTKDLIKATAGRTVSPIAIKVAAGDATGGAIDLATDKIFQKAQAQSAVGQTYGASNTFNDLAGELDSLFNPAAALGVDKDTGTFTRETVQRLMNQATTDSENLISAVTDPLQPGRLEESQLKAGFQATLKTFNQQYPELNDSVMRVVPVNKADQLTDTETLAVHIGNKDAQPFKSMQQAHNSAKNYYKINGNYEVRQYGDGQFYIEVQKPIDETSKSVRDTPLIGTDHETPKTFMNAFLGYLRTPDDLLSAKTMEGMKATVYGSSAFGKRVQDAALPITSLRKSYRKDFSSFLERQRDYVDPETGSRGKFSNTLGEFERDYMSSVGRKPTEGEASAYQAYKRLNDYRYLVYNMDLVRDKARQGMENFKLPWKYYAKYDKGKVPKAMLSDNIEGKYLPDGIPWDNPEEAGILIHNGDPTKGLQYVNTKYTNASKFEDTLGGEKYHTIQLSPTGERQLREDMGFKDYMPKGRINFVVTKDFDTRPLGWKQIPYQAGGRVEYPEGWFTRQPQITPMEEGGQVVRHRYDGDLNVMNHRTETDAKRFADNMETARVMLTNNLEPITATKVAARAEINNFLEKNLPWDFDSFKGLFKTEDNPEGYLDLHTPIYATKKGYTVNDAYKLSDKYVNLSDSRESSYNLYNSVNLKYGMERDRPIMAVSKQGDPDHPLWNFKPATLVDPLSTLQRSVGQLMRGRYLEDVKFSLSEQFINEFGDQLKTPVGELRANPMKHLMDPDWKPSPQDRGKYAAARNFRRTAINFLGMKNDFQKNISWVKQKVADSIFENMGEKTFNVVEPYLLSTTKDPITFMRSVTFHTSLAMFNPVQMFVQAQTIAHTAAIEGLGAAYKGVSAAVLMRRLAINNNPEMVARAAKMATAFGWKPEDFLESYEGLRRSGMWHVGGETAVRDDYFEPNIIQSGSAKFLDKGTMFFAEGERLTRLTAWNAAYRRWRLANPTAKFDNDAMLGVLNRADLLNANMSSASTAAWGKGFASIPTQFMNYQARLMEQFLGKRLTPMEKSRAILTYAAMYGIPATPVIPFAAYPFFGDIRQKLMEKGIDYDDNIVSKTLVDGLGSMILEFATGTKFDVGQRYGPGDVSMLKNVLSGDQTMTQTLLGASGTSLGNILNSLEPMTMSIVNSMRGDDDWFPVATSDINDFMSNISTWNNARKMYTAMHFGQYISKNEVAIDKMSGMEGLFAGLTGLEPQSIEDTFLKMDSNKELKAMQEPERKEAIKYYRKAFQATTDTDRAGFFKAAKMHLIAGGFDDEDKVDIIRQAAKGNESLMLSVGADFAKQSPERLDAWINEIHKHDDGQ